MDLAGLGKTAGLGGIAIGAAVVVMRALIDRAGKAKPGQLALYRLIAIGSFCVGGLGIVAWLVAGGGTHVEAGSCGMAVGGNASGNAVSCGTVPTVPPKS